MKPYQERVVEEKKELDEKIDRLTEFLKHRPVKDLPSDEFERMNRQLGAMSSYSGILAERISHFNA